MKTLVNQATIMTGCLLVMAAGVSQASILPTCDSFITIGSTSWFSATMVTPAASDRVDTNKCGTFTFSLNGDKDTADFVSAMNNDYLRLGVYVQAFSDGGNAAYLNAPHITFTPEPATVAILGLCSFIVAQSKSMYFGLGY